MIWTHTPTGSLRVYTCMSGWRTGIVVPKMRSGHPAKWRRWATVPARSTTLASFSGLPLSSDSSSASSSPLASTSSAKRPISRPRSAAEARLQSLSANAARAAATARSTSAAPGLGDGRDHAAGRRIERLEGGAVGGGHPLTADQQLLITAGERAGGVGELVGERGDGHQFERTDYGLKNDLQSFTAVIDRVRLGGVVERHVMRDERRWVDGPGLEHREHPVDVADDISVSALDRQRLDPDEAHVDLGGLGVHADRDDGSGLAGKADREVERIGVTRRRRSRRRRRGRR